MPKIEALFGGLLVLFIVGVVAFAALTGRFGGTGGGFGGGGPTPGGSASAPMTECGCFDRGFDLAESYDVQSAEYSTHFVLCRETLGEKGGRAFTAGWNARISPKPWEATCEAWMRRNG